MARRAYSFTRDGRNRLVLTWWKYSCTDLTVSLDGTELMKNPDRKPLEDGITVNIDDDQELEIRLVRGNIRHWFNRLLVSLNGKPLPYTSGDPVIKWRGAYHALFILAALYFGLNACGFLGFKSDDGFITNAGILFGWSIGIIFAILGFCVLKRQIIALWIAIILLGLLMMPSLIPLLGGVWISALDVLADALLIAWMYRGFKGLAYLAEQEKDTETSLPPLPG